LFEFLFKYSRATFERGEILFASGWPLWLLGLSVVAAAVAIGVSLVRNRADFGWLKLGVVGVMQVGVVAVLLTMLWRPSLLTQTLRPQDNSIAVLVDASASMGYGEGDRSRLQQAVATLEGGPLPDLESEFQVDLLGFSGEVFSLPSLQEMPAPGEKTDIGEALLSVLRGASAGSLAAIVLVSDGADNSGRLDPARVAEIAGFGVPVHTLGVGREVIEEDIELEDVVVSSRATPGSTVGAQVSIRHGRGGVAQLKVYDGDAILVTESIQLPDQAGVTTRLVDIEVGEAGIRDLRFALDAVAGEINTVNNVQQRPMEVPERRRSVLYVEGEPRWEYKYVRRAVVDDEVPIRFVTLLRTTPNKFYRQGVSSGDELADGFPTEESELFSYDALVLGSLEAAALTEEQRQMIYDFVSRRGGTLLMLGASRGLADGGWGATVVNDVLPVDLPPDLDAPRFIRLPARPLLPQGEQSLITRFDADDAANRTIWEELPLLKDLQLIETDELKPGAEVLLEAEFNGETRPLLVRHRFGQGAAYVLAGSTWGWQMSLPHDDMKHETFWRQLLQALTTAPPEPVTLTTERVYYGDQAQVTLRADVRDSDYQPATAASVDLAIDAPGEATRNVLMEAVPGVPGRYELTLDADAAGIYRFEAEASLNGESLGRSRVAVRREDGRSEHFQVQQNRALLERLSAATGGRYFSLADADDIPEAVQFSDAGIVERRLLELWNMPILFLLLLGLKAGEWMLRLVWGRL
jgi:uncharacterized membrane protein